MKKITLLLISLLALTASAQVTIKPGVRAGLNLATIINTETDTKADFYVGGFVAIKLAKFYTLQPEVNYSRQGAKGIVYDFPYPTVLPVEGREADFSIQYLSLGVMNKFNIVKGFHATVGPTIDFRVGDNFREYTTERPYDMDIGFNAGLGYTLPMGLTIEARYKVGLIDIFGRNIDNNDDDYYRDEDPRLNSVLQLGVSYAF